MKKLSSEDRATLIRLASSLPKGSPEKKAILAGLAKTKTGAEFGPFSTLEALVTARAHEVGLWPKSQQGDMLIFERIGSGYDDNSVLASRLHSKLRADRQKVKVSTTPNTVIVRLS
jgi:hypothetical protein